MSRIEHLLNELRRRRVLRALSIYAGAAWLLIGVCDIALPMFNAPDWMMRTLIWAALAGLPVTALVSWFFDITPIRPEQDSTARKRPWDVVVIAVLLTALGVSIFFNLARPESVGELPPASVAVMPFTDRSADQDHAFFGDGLAEELLNLLTQNPALQVAARTSSFSFRDTKLPVTDVARQLQVAYVLEGSVRRDNEKLRVSAQLISGRDGYHVWSETYDEAFNDVFSIQEKIALQIAAALEAGALGARHVRRTDPNAYLSYLRASHLARTGTPESMQQALELFEQTLAVDPEYAPAWSRLSSVYGSLASRGHMDYESGFEAAKHAARRAIEASADHADGFVQLAWIAHRYEGNLAAAAQHMQQALSLEPRSVSGLQSAAVLMLQLGQIDDAIAVLEHCAKRSPLDAKGHFNLGVARKYGDRLNAALQSFQTVTKLNPDYDGVIFQLAETLLLMDRPDDALANFEQLEGFRRPYGRALVEHARGNSDASNAALAQLIDGWGDDWPGTVADVHAFRGELDPAFEWLELDFQKFGAAGWGELKLQRLLDNLKGDSRWHELLERAGATDEQLAALAIDVSSLRSTHPKPTE